MKEFLLNNPYVIFLCFIVIFSLLYKVYIYFRKPNSQELKSVREWLLWAVADAEKRLGSGTGQLKLRYVYNMFIDRFAHLSTIITFDMFSGMVDNALDELRKLLDDNTNVNEYIEGSNKRRR